MRYARLYLNFLRFSFSRAFEFRIDFFFRVVMDCCYYAMNIAFFKLVYLHTNTLAGWTEPQMLIFIAGFTVLDGFQMTVLSNNMWMLPQLVNSGDLDYYLLRPVSPLFFLSLRDFAANSCLNFFIGIGFFIYAIANYPGDIPFVNFLVYLVFLVNGILLYYFMRMLSVLPVFWTHSTQGFESLIWSFTKFMERPDRIFTGTLRIILLTVLPYSLMVSVPTHFLFDGPSWSFAALAFGATAFFALAIRALWGFALRSYSSASS